MRLSALLCHQNYAGEGLHIVRCVHTSIPPRSEILALVPQIGVHDPAPPLVAGGFWKIGIYCIGVGIESHVKAAPALPFVVEGEGQEAAIQVVPVVLMPGDVARAKELRTPQQGMLSPKVNQATAGSRHNSVLTEQCCEPQQGCNYRPGWNSTSTFQEQHRCCCWI